MEELGRSVGAQIASGRRVSFQRADVAVEADIASLVEACVEHAGAPTILVNNAGVNANYDATEMTEAEWDRFFAVDLKAAWLAAKRALPHMKAAGRGAIVNVSSHRQRLLAARVRDVAAAPLRC